jgi:hypothetical protein
MSNREHIGGENHVGLIAAFSQNIEIEPETGYFAGVKLNKDWQLTNEVYPFKISAVNESAGIFVKKYSSHTGDYAQKAFAALRELSELPLSTPILAPTALHENTLVFKKGEVKEKRSIYSSL